MLNLRNRHDLATIMVFAGIDGRRHLRFASRGQLHIRNTEWQITKPVFFRHLALPNNFKCSTHAHTPPTFRRHPKHFTFLF